MTWNIDKVKELISPKLETKEEILAVSLYRTGPPWWFAIFNPGAITRLTYMCLTSKQLYLIPVDFDGKFNDKNIQGVNFENVRLEGKKLMIESSSEDKPVKYYLIGTPKLAGINVEEFENNLKRIQENLTLKSPRPSR